MFSYELAAINNLFLQPFISIYCSGRDGARSFSLMWLSEEPYAKLLFVNMRNVFIVGSGGEVLQTNVL